MTRTLAIHAGVLPARSQTARPEGRASLQRGDAELIRAGEAARSRDECDAADPVTTGLSARVPNAKGSKERVPTLQHRFVARAEAQVGLAGNTRTLRTTHNLASTTPGAAAKDAVDPADAACEKLLGEPAGGGMPVP